MNEQGLDKDERINNYKTSTNPPSACEPDLLFIAKEHSAHIRPGYMDGPVDLAVEIISPESTQRNRQVKFAEYEAGSVREYWLIDPEREQVEFYQLGEDGRYRLAWGGHAGQYESAVLAGLTVQVEWLWQDSPPLKFKYLVE